jgi:hypothetical protein
MSRVRRERLAISCCWWCWGWWGWLVGERGAGGAVGSADAKEASAAERGGRGRRPKGTHARPPVPHGTTHQHVDVLVGGAVRPLLLLAVVEHERLEARCVSCWGATELGRKFENEQSRREGGERRALRAACDEGRGPRQPRAAPGNWASSIVTNDHSHFSRSITLRSVAAAMVLPRDARFKKAKRGEARALCLVGVGGGQVVAGVIPPRVSVCMCAIDASFPKKAVCGVWTEKDEACPLCPPPPTPLPIRADRRSPTSTPRPSPQ